MQTSLSRVFGPQQFPGDLLKTRQAKLFNQCVWFSSALAVLTITADLLGGRIGIEIMSVAIVALVLTPMLHHVARRGRLRLAGALLLLLLFSGLVLGIAMLGTIRAPTLGAFGMLVVISGILFGYGGLGIACGMSSLAVGGLILAERGGLLPTPDYHVGITQWLMATTVFGCLGGLTFSVITDIHDALAKTEHEVAERQRAEETLRQTNAELAEALASVKTLKGFLPVCAWCRKVRQDDGYWNELEIYVTQHTDARFSHGICPACRDKNFGGLQARKMESSRPEGPA